MDSTNNTTVSNNSSQSPTNGALLENPISLDFDPMSFQFKEDSPLTSPSENSRELIDALSPSQNLDVIDFFDPFCPVKEESPTDYYPTISIDQHSVEKFNTNESPSEFPLLECSFSKKDNYSSQVADLIDECETSDKFKNNDPLQIDRENPSNLASKPTAESENLEFTQIKNEKLTSTYQEVNDKSDNLHDFEQDEVFQHDECENLDIDALKKARTSTSSSISSVKSEKIIRKTSSTSSSDDTRQDEKRHLQTTRKEEKTTQHIDSKNPKSDKQKYEAHNGVKSNIISKMNINKNHVDDSNFKSKDIKKVSLNEKKSSLSKANEDALQNHGKEEEVKPSVDRAKVQRTFSQTIQDDISLCKICGKHVYQMEKMKAEKHVFHKNCFRCKECNKLLNVDTYSSNEGDLYCKLHFKQLFQPKARFDGDDLAPKKQRRNEIIIRENIPAELPPDVVRSDSKPDHGLESLPVNLSSLKSKFEQYREDHHLPSTTDACTLQRSASVMARLAKYQSVIAGENAENGNVSSSESECECEDPAVVKPTKHKEKVVFSGMSNLKSQWETGSVTVNKEEKVEEKKEELNKLRQRMCLGRSESMKAVYEKACQDSTKIASTNKTEPVDIGRDIKAIRLKEKFEKGELVSEADEEKLEKARREKEEDLSVFTEPVMASDAKKLFRQIDEKAKTNTMTPLSPSKSQLFDPKTEHRNLYSQLLINEANIVKCSEPSEKEEIHVDTTDLSQRFKFFENYTESPKERKRFQMTPPRELQKENSPDPTDTHDPSIVRAVDKYDEIPTTDTARRMLDKFKALEKETPSVPSGPKPLKRITPPREYTREDNHDSSPEPDRDPNIIRASYKSEEDIIIEADKAKNLREKFENWDLESFENRKNEDDMDEDFLPQVDTTKTLRAKFEAIKEDTLKPLEKSKPKVNRFV